MNSMLYWFGVYGLVVIAGLLPVLLLYVSAGIVRLGMTAIRLMIRSLKNVWAVRTDLLSGKDWGMILR
jgi:hypothetical protein